MASNREGGGPNTRVGLDDGAHLKDRHELRKAEIAAVPRIENERLSMQRRKNFTVSHQVHPIDRSIGCAADPVTPGTRLGHVHLRVFDLERSLCFYCDVLGFELMQYRGTQAALISAGGYHHLIALNTRQALGGAPPARGTTGLDHFAIVYPTRTGLARALRRLIASNIAFERASDHGVSESVYVRDPDGIVIELSWDRPAEEWPRTPTGRLAAGDKPLDVPELLRACEHKS
jgi:catechol 2,3-dioxygenase